jgi:hypothetical protein|tara:strand:- start:298 stop:477 length:180 start_codon:yes stop_codon:yes gene_type:complete
MNDKWPYPVKIETRIEVLETEIEVLKSRYNPDHSKIDVLYIFDTISMLELRIKELNAQI